MQTKIHVHPAPPLMPDPVPRVGSDKRADPEGGAHMRIPLLRVDDAISMGEERPRSSIGGAESRAAPPLFLRAVLLRRSNPLCPGHLLPIPCTRTSSTFPAQASTTSLQPPPPKPLGIEIPAATLLLPAQDPAAPSSSCQTDVSRDWRWSRRERARRCAASWWAAMTE